MLNELPSSICFDDAAIAAMIVAYDLTCNSLSDASPATLAIVEKH
jgi:hypothetical protein